LNAAERASNAAVAVTANPSRREMVVATPEPNSGPASAQTAGAAQNQLASKTYTFDGVFGPDATQAEVYESAIEPIVLETLEGFNCTVFAYGQTGTGKTHTMEGAGDEKKEKMERASDTPNASLASNDAIPTNAGIVPRALRQIFSHLANTTTEYSVKCTFLELYNEEITDLLSDDGDEKSAESSGVGDSSSSGKRSHRLMEDGRGGVSVEGLTEVTVKNVQDALRLAKTGSGRRKKAATLCNKHSSRSHSVFSIAVTTRAPSVDEEGEDLIKIGKLNLVDLAGSENVGKSGVAEKGATARSREAGEINKSLLTLGRVVTALVDKLAHVPYRDSKLTRLLRDALGGKSKTCILATVGPSVASVEETVATAEYASRARSVRCKPEVNRRVTKIRLVRELQREVQRLGADLIATREKNGVFVSPETFAAEQSSKKQREEKISVLERTLQDKEKRLAELFAQNEAYERAKEDINKRVADYETKCASLMEKNKRREDALTEASELAERTRIEVAKEKARRKDAEEKNDVSASETLRLFDRCDRFETREEAISNQLDAVASRAKVASSLFEKAFSEAARAAKKAARSEKKKRLEEKRKEAFAVVFESARSDIERAKEAAMSACAEATKSLERARIAFLAASRGPSGDDSSSSEDESGDECSSAAATAAVSAALAAAAAVSVPADAPSGATPTRATATALAAARKAPEESAEDGASQSVPDSDSKTPAAAAEMRATRAKTSSLPRAPLRELGENVEEAA
jgi:hypothetical protein